MIEQISETPEKTVQPETIPEKKLKITPSKVFLLVILGMLILAGAVYAGMIIGKKQTPPGIIPQAMQPTPTPDPTANWETYINDKYGISFKYPKEWEYAESATKTNLNNDSLMVTLAKKENMQPLPVGGLPNIQVQVTESTDPLQFSFYEWTNVTGETTIDGIQAEMRQHKDIDDNKEVVFVRNGSTYQIISQGHIKEASQNKVFDQILSTFKFLE